MPPHDREVPSWTRGQLWSKDDARRERARDRFATAIVLVSWLAVLTVTYPWIQAGSVVRPMPVSPPSMSCHVDQHAALHERVRLWPAASPVIPCVMRLQHSR